MLESGDDAQFLQALDQHELVFVRTPEDRSVVVERDGHQVMVACTDRALLRSWWTEHAGADAAAPFVRELPFRQLVGLWAAPDVDLLVDPAPGGGGVLVSVDAARRHLGLGPTVPAKDPTEPLPFAGLSGGRSTLRLPALIALIGVGLIIGGLTSSNLVVVVGGLLGLAAAVLSAGRSSREMRAGIAANRRLTESERRRRAAPGTTD